MAEARELGIIGLGRMGGGLALSALEKGFRVVGTARGGASSELVAAGLVGVEDAAGLARELAPPRIVLLYIPAGAVVDEVLDTLAGVLERGDIVADGGNSYWGDSIRRGERLRARGLSFIDLGTSGGVSGAREGACFMAGGEREPVARLEPILRQLAVEGGFVHAGPIGAGHFTKLVHNGIEFGMLQAIGEGVALLEGYRDRLDVGAVLECWRHGSVIRSWLIDLMRAAYAEAGGLERTPPYVEDTGEVNWLVDDALHMEVPTPVIAQAVIQLVASRDGRSAASRAVALMRHGFGGHPFGPSEPVADERHHGRVGSYLDDGEASLDDGR